MIRTKLLGCICNDKANTALRTGVGLPGLCSCWCAPHQAVAGANPPSPGSANHFSRTAGARDCSRSAAGTKVLSLGRDQSVCVDVSCGSHPLLKQREGSGPYADTTFGCSAAGEGRSLLKMYHSLVVRGLSLPWGPGSSTRGPLSQA